MNTKVYYKLKHKTTGLFLSYGGRLVYDVENKDSEGVWDLDDVKLQLELASGDYIIVKYTLTEEEL